MTTGYLLAFDNCSDCLEKSYNFQSIQCFVLDGHCIYICYFLSLSVSYPSTLLLISYRAFSCSVGPIQMGSWISLVMRKPMGHKFGGNWFMLKVPYRLYKCPKWYTVHHQGFRSNNSTPKVCKLSQNYIHSRASKSWGREDLCLQTFFENLRKTCSFDYKIGETGTCLQYWHDLTKFFQVFHVFMAC